jgi:hypothetical protein
MSADLVGTTLYLRMELKQDGDKLSGPYTGDKLTTGTINSGAIHLLATSDDGTTSDVNATVKDGVITGSAGETDPKDIDKENEILLSREFTDPVDLPGLSTVRRERLLHAR